MFCLFINGLKYLEYMITVHLEMISDYICPWCYLGKARLERVKAILKGEIELEIEVKPFLLYPSIPKGGVPKSVFATKTKYGMGRALKAEAQEEQINFNYKYIERIPNSFEAHRMTWLISDNHQKYEFAKQVFFDYFEKGQNIEDPSYLQSVAQSVGVEDDKIQSFSTTNAGEEACQASILASKEAFVSVVPSIRLDRQFLITGLQSAEVFEKYIRRAANIQTRNM